MKKIRFVKLCIVHNNNAIRNDGLFASVDKLIEQLCLQGFNTELKFVVSQPQIERHALQTLLKKKWRYRQLGRAWDMYRNLDVRPLFIDIGLYCKYLYSLLKGGVCYRKKQATNSFVESLVSEKHLRAWSKLLDSDNEILIVFEDDVIFKNQSIDRLISILEADIVQDSEGPFYIDLAGGMNDRQLRVSNLMIKSEGGFNFYSKPVTNTACAYLVNRSLVDLFNLELIRDPTMRLIGIDWLMNKCFMSLMDSGLTITCAHSSPTVFDHGTFTGNYRSWSIDPPIKGNI